MKNKFNKTLLATLLALPLAVQAGGMHLYEIGTTDLGLAAAGTAARADDASTIYTNPAGMTRLSGHQLTTGVQALYGVAKYESNASGSLGNVNGLRPDANVFYSHSVSDRLKLGIGLYGNYGMELDFGKQWSGRYLASKVELKAASLQPTVAYKVNEQLSVGGGLVASYGYTTLERQDLYSPGTTLKTKDDDWAYGARLGVMFEPSRDTRLGVTWQSKITHHFNVSNTGLWHYGLGLGQAVRPEELMGSIWHRLNDRWAVMGNIGWQGWSKFTNTLMQHRTGLPPLELKDTWHTAVGAQYQWDAKTRLNFGVAYDSSFYQTQADTTLLIPNGPVWRIGTGVQYALTPKDEVGFAVGYLRTKDGYDITPASSPIAQVAGKYDSPHIYFMSMQYTHKF